MPQRPIQTLADALTFLRWDPSRHGELLCVAPQNAKRLAQATLGVPPPEGWVPQDIAAAFGRRVRRFGSLTVLGLDEHVVYNPRPVEDAPQRGYDAFFAGLSPAQWQQLCGAGIPFALLLAARALPDPLVCVGQGKTISLRPEEQREAVLTLRKHVVLEPKGTLLSVPVMTAYSLGKGLLARQTPEPPKKSTLFQWFPQRPSTGQLHTASLGGTVALGGNPTLTVAELLERTSKAMGVRLQADARVAALPLWLRSEAESVPIKTLLEALCFAVGGVFRKTTEGFLLVEDTTPLQLRRAATAEWDDDRRRTRKRASEQELRDFFAPLGDLLEAIPFSRGDMLALSGSQLSLYRGLQRAGKPTVLPESALTAGQRTGLEPIVRQSRETATAIGKSGGVLESVFVSLSASLCLELAGERLTLTSLTLPTEPARIALRGRQLLLQVRDKESVTELVELAQKAGVAALWLDAPPAVIEAALATKSLPIFARVPLLRSAKGVAARNAQGETWSAYCRRRFKRTEEDWLDPGVASNLALVLKQVQKVAALPGLAGLVFSDTVPPGFREDWFGCQTSQLGFTPERCRAFLKKQGIDPQDILPEYGDKFNDENEGRLFPPATPYESDWREERQGESQRFLESVQKALHAEWPGLTVWWGGGETWLVRGMPSKPLPELYPYGPDSPKGYPVEWLVAPDKQVDAVVRPGVLDATRLSPEKVRVGLRSGEF